ncbi:LacI family DNA-binding transcriptional regulator [Paenibacillus arenilitoris]
MAFSKKRPISRQVTEKVFRAAKELGYYPNHVARSLAIRKTMIAGLRIPLPPDGYITAFESQLINGVIKECSRQGYRVLLDNLPELDDPAQFSQDPVDGLIMLNPRTNDPRIERYGQMGIPFVSVGRPDPFDESMSYVDNNNAEVAYQIGDYLLRNGHRSVFFLNASADMTVAHDRQSGLKDVFRRYGVPFPEENIIHFSHRLFANGADYGYLSIRDTFGKLHYSAVVTDTDRVAFGALRAARELGIEVPKELSVIAFSNDTTLSQDMNPRLTSVELSANRLGEEAAKLLIEKMRDMSVNRQVIIPASLVIGETCCVQSRSLTNNEE